MSVKDLEKLPEDVALRLIDVHKFYGDFHALRNVSFDVKIGRITGFLGPNGAGKTTTMKIAITYMPPSIGTVLVSDGTDTWNAYSDPLRTRRQIGYLPENFPTYNDLKVKEYLSFVARLRGVSDVNREVDKVAALCGLSERLNWFIGHLSKGYKQRVGIAQAIIGDPKILILDEPTQALDPVEVVKIRELIKELAENRTVILSTHIMWEVEKLADDVIIINRGEIVAQESVERLREKLTRSVIVEVLAADISSDKLADTLRGILKSKGITETKVEPKSVSQEVKAIYGDNLGGVLLELQKERAPEMHELNSMMISSGLRVLHVNLVQRSIEDIFLELINQHERGRRDEGDAGSSDKGVEA